MKDLEGYLLANAGRILYKEPLTAYNDYKNTTSCPKSFSCFDKFVKSTLGFELYYDSDPNGTLSAKYVRNGKGNKEDYL